MPIIEDIQCVRARDPAAGSWAEVLLCYPGLYAIIAHRLNHWLWLYRFRLLARIGSQLARWLTGIEIHPAAVIGRRCFIDHGMGVVIGETAQLGNDVTLYHGVTLGSAVIRDGKRHPNIGDRVMIGAGAKVLGAITVHSDASIGANAVVLRDVPAGATVVGVPGKVVRIKPGSGELSLLQPPAWSWRDDGVVRGALMIDDAAVQERLAKLEHEMAELKLRGASDKAKDRELVRKLAGSGESVL